MDLPSSSEHLISASVDIDLFLRYNLKSYNN